MGIFTKFTRAQIIWLSIIIILIIAGIIYTFLPSKEPLELPDKEESSPEVFSITGKVILVNFQENSFVIVEPKEQKEFAVNVGEEAEMTQLIFPFDIHNPPPEATFTPERKPVTVLDLNEGSQVFVRSSHSIKEGQDILNPIEIQILP